MIYKRYIDGETIEKLALKERIQPERLAGIISEVIACGKPIRLEDFGLQDLTPGKSLTEYFQKKKEIEARTM